MVSAPVRGPEPDTRPPAVSEPKRSLVAVVAVLVAAPLLLLIVLVSTHWTNVPFWDEWEFVSIIRAHHDGTLTFAAFWAQHNEHRILFPNLVMFALAWATRWDVRFEMALSLVIATASFGLLLLTMRRTVPLRWAALALAPPASLVYFSPVQWENWLWGWQIEWFMAVAGLLLAVWALCGWHSAGPATATEPAPQPAPPWRQLAVAMAGATLSTYSLGSGMLVWAACLPLVLFSPRLRRWTPVWVAVAAVEALLYFHNYTPGRDDSGIANVLAHPAEFAEYLALYLSRPLLGGLHVATAEVTAGGMVGFLVLAAAYLLARRAADRWRTLSMALPWLCIGGYAVMAGAVTGSARMSSGLEQALSPRYTTISQLLAISVLVVAAIVGTVLFRDAGAARRMATLVPAAAIVAVVLLALANYSPAIRDMRAWSAIRERAHTCALTATSADDPCLRVLYPDQKAVWDKIQYLRSIGWADV
jgi:hypothetical protein